MKMSDEFFEEVLNNRLESIRNVLSVKAKEYVRNEDRMHNFNEASKCENITREQAIHNFMLKHYISYKDMLSDIALNKLPSEKYVEEKIGDLINYFILFEASIKQKIREVNSFIEISDHFINERNQQKSG